MILSEIQKDDNTASTVFVDKKQLWLELSVFFVNVVFLSTKTVDAVLSSFCIFESIKNWNNPPGEFFFPPSMLPFFFCFIFFFQPEGPRLFMWKDVANLNMACFNSRISFPWQVGGKKKWRKTFSYKHTLFPIKGFFLSCKGKKILKKNHSWPVDPVFQ